MTAPNSLLRPTIAATLGGAVLAFAAPAFAASPDPSPSAGYSPDPYPTQPAPQPRVTAPPAPAHVVVVPHTATVVVHAAAAPKQKPAKRTTIAPVRRPTTTPAVEVPDHRAAGFFALTAPKLTPDRSVSPVLASALGMFVLLSALFLVGATRAVQRR